MEKNTVKLNLVIKMEVKKEKIKTTRRYFKKLLPNIKKNKISIKINTKKIEQNNKYFLQLWISKEQNEYSKIKENLAVNLFVVISNLTSIILKEFHNDITYISGSINSTSNSYEMNDSTRKWNMIKDKKIIIDDLNNCEIINQLKESDLKTYEEYNKEEYIKLIELAINNNNISLNSNYWHNNQNQKKLLIKCLNKELEVLSMKKVIKHFIKFFKHFLTEQNEIF